MRFVYPCGIVCPDMRTVTISMRPQRPGYNLRVMENEGAANYFQDWRKKSVVHGIFLSLWVREGRCTLDYLKAINLRRLLLSDLSA